MTIRLIPFSTETGDRWRGRMIGRYVNFSALHFRTPVIIQTEGEVLTGRM